MAKRLATRPVLPAQVIHYVDPATPAELAYPLNPADLAAKQRKDAVLYARWKARQVAIAERERKFRRFWLGFGAVIALALLAVLGVGVWLIWLALTSINLGALAIPLGVLVFAGGLLGGHHCVTTVTHRH